MVYHNTFQRHHLLRVRSNLSVPYAAQFVSFLAERSRRHHRPSLPRSSHKNSNSSKEVSYFVTSTFLLGYVPSVILWGPGSEMYGRRAELIPALMAYILFHLGQTLAQNMAAVLVTRFLCGFFACAPLNNCGDLLADLWDAATRVPASSLLFATTLLDPALGPTLGGL